MSLFELREASLSYGGPPAVDSVNLQIEGGEFVGILGPNGAGKSSLLRLLSGLRQPTGGQVSFAGRWIHRWSPRERARQIAFVPQWTVMAFPFRVEEVVLMGRHPHLGRLAFESARDLAAAEEAMQRTDTRRFRDRAFGELSGGEMQRVVVARAIAQSARAMLLDEPTSSLDLHHQQRIYAILRERNAAGTTVIVTTHDLNLASISCRRLLLLHRGRIAADGAPDEVLTEARIEEVYGAPVEILRRAGRLLVLPRSLGGEG